ncbi:ferredoxin [Kutzneria sp. CA-103260]|nr:ferredoxin [Kutzneria sp. CA-103260]
MAIEVDRNLCEANGLCVAAVPEVFELDSDEELVIHEAAVDTVSAERIKVAVASCPRYALRVTG